MACGGVSGESAFRFSVSGVWYGGLYVSLYGCTGGLGCFGCSVMVCMTGCMAVVCCGCVNGSSVSQLSGMLIVLRLFARNISFICFANDFLLLFAYSLATLMHDVIMFVLSSVLVC